MVDKEKKGTKTPKDTAVEDTKKPAKKEASATKKAAPKKAAPKKKGGVPAIPKDGDGIDRLRAMVNSLDDTNANDALADEQWRTALGHSLEEAMGQVSEAIGEGKFPSVMCLSTFMPLYARIKHHIQKNGSDPTQEEFEEYLEMAMDSVLVEDVDVLQSVMDDYFAREDDEVSEETKRLVDAARILVEFGGGDQIIADLYVAVVGGLPVGALECEQLPEFEVDEPKLDEESLYKLAKSLDGADLPGMALRTLRLIEELGMKVKPKVTKMIDELIEAGAEEPGSGCGCGCDCGDDGCEECEECEEEK